MKKANKLYTLTLDGQERFSFHATDAGDADRKVSNWANRHGMRRNSGQWEINEGAGRYGDIQQDWVRGDW